MCGIIGIVGKDHVSDRLVDGLRRMEYRGYDSAGVCTIYEGQLVRRRAEGKLNNLVVELAHNPAPGAIGIAHTRWATHGAPTTSNAHPHATGEVALVHNGIIENFRPLREELIARGRTFESETDTEVVAHLVSEQIEAGASPTDAVKAVLPRLRGAFALAIAFRQHPDLLIGARLGSPLVVGYGDGETFLGSDALALAPLTQRVSYLEEGDWVVITREGASVFDIANNPVTRAIVASGASAAAIEKGNFRHFMQKEIYEQPIVVAQTLRSYLRRYEQQVSLPQIDFDLASIKRVTIVACGTSYYAGMVAKYWFEQFARLPVDIDVASEFRYRDPVLEAGGLAIFISQSGETADTLAALRDCQGSASYLGSLAIVQRAGISSHRARIGPDLLMPTRAGPEIGVASTKAFTTQLTALAAACGARTCAAQAWLDQRKSIRNAYRQCSWTSLPARARRSAEAHDAGNRQARANASCRRATMRCILGRGPCTIRSRSKARSSSRRFQLYSCRRRMPAGELKHGPLALVDEDRCQWSCSWHRGQLLEKTQIQSWRKCARAAASSFLISDATPYCRSHAKR